MSNHFSGNSTGDAINTPKKIRSKHRLRMMLRLSEGEETVSDLAKLVGLRVPHASAEIRKMREESLVTSDLPVGSRGAKMSLTDNGWNVLQTDEWSKALVALPLPREIDKYTILYRDKTDILFAFLDKPNEPMIMIPDRMPGSTGNDGVSWSWASLNESGPRWFNLDSMEISLESPVKPDPQSIDAYSKRPRIIGIIRGKVLNNKAAITASVGKWFSAPSDRHGTPLTETSYHRGIWKLGKSHEMIPLIKPKNPIVGIMKDSLYKSMLLRTAKRNALVIGDLRGLDSGGTMYPLDVLEYWIEISHPRITIQDRKRRLTALKDKIVRNKRVRVSDSTWRKFRKDWGASSFSQEKYSKNIDIRGLNRIPIESLIRWSIENESHVPLVLEIKNKISESTLSLITSHSNLRLIILENMISGFENYDILEMNKFRPLPWLNFRTKDGTLPLKLIESQYEDEEYQSKVKLTVTPWEIRNIEMKSDFIPEELNEDYYSMVKSSISQYPLGDEEWANQIEAKYPLASWIASPPSGRWPRWQRLRNRLDSEWLALLDLDHLPIERLVEVANEAPISVLNIFSEEMKYKLREDSDIFLRSRPAIDSNSASPGVSWIAGQFLSSVAWMPENIHNDILEWAINAWVKNPPIDSLQAIKGIYWLYNKEQKNRIKLDEMMMKFKNKNKDISDDNILKIWSDMIDMIVEKKELKKQDLQLVVKRLPPDWWAIHAQNLLRKALKNENMKWLLSMDLPWCSTIMRRKGEEVDVPGISSKNHPGCDFSIYDDLKMEISNIENNSILDLFESLHSSINMVKPKIGRTHELVGWLAQPIEKWPDFTQKEISNGEVDIMKRIMLRKTSFSYKKN